MRAIFADSNLSLNLWSELLATAAYLRNQSSIKSLKIENLTQTPFVTLYNNKPDFSNESNLKIINCQTWALIFEEKRSKLNFMSSNYRILDYAVSTQYILYKVESKRVIFS
jgi:hypothetical protein